MNLGDVERAVEATDAGPLLVPARILRRVIKKHRRVPGMGMEVPHHTSYVVDRASLLALATEEEIGRAATSLPPSVILLPKPNPEDDPAERLVALWRGAFHAAVHRAIERRVDAGEVSAAAIRARIHAIGQTEFDEIRFVLRQDDLLLPPHDDAGVYCEFAATYLELRTFDPAALSRTFPALGEGVEVIDRTLAQDVDVEALLSACRPAPAPPIDRIAEENRPKPEPEPPPPPPPPSREPRVDPRAEAARARGNVVRAILLRARATGTEHAVRAELRSLLERVAAAVGEPADRAEEWAARLAPLVGVAPSASPLPWNTAARLLYDLQRACIDHERDIFTVGVVEWALSLGRRPVRRALPAQREVRVAKHLRSALAKLPRVRLPEAEHGPIAAILHVWVRAAEERLRRALRPRLSAALREVGLLPKNVPERVAETKLIEEMVDQVAAHGMVSLGHLRDAVARNNLKMDNLAARELWHGDALLRADALLAVSLDGVYRRGEIYVRVLQKLSSLFFGTRAGRFLTLYLILPVLFSYVAIEGVHHMVGPLLEHGFDLEVHFLSPWSLGALSVYVFLLIHTAWARAASRRFFRAVFAVLRAIFWRAPAWFLGLPPVKRALASRPARLFGRFVLKPAAVSAVGWVIVPLLDLDRRVAIAGGILAFVALNLLLNSRPGVLLEEAVIDWTVRRWRQLHRRVLPGLLAFVAAGFRRVIEAMDRAIYSVDELLRFREGDRLASVVVKGGLGVAWFFATYLIRFYVNLLIEPEINPIKHFPVVTVAAKIMIPLNMPIHDALRSPLAPVLGGFLTETFVAPTVFFLPGFFGFLTWELKENFRLYGMNRPRELRPVLIGHHGETMVRFMKPGFHSGTVPKAYAKLRRAAWKGARSILKHQEDLHHVAEAVQRFFERELAGLLAGAAAWKHGPVEIGHVDIASNRMRVALSCPAVDNHHARVAFEEQSGWLVGGVPEAGFLSRLDDSQRLVFENALAGLYKMAGVEIVREQLAAALDAAPYDIAAEGLVVWPDGSYETEVVYALTSSGALAADVRAGRATPKPLHAREVLFREEPLTWDAWVQAWSTERPARLLRGAEILPPRAPR